MKKLFGLVAIFCNFALISSAQNIVYKAVPKETIESRLNQYGGKDSQREATLKQMFAEAGCDDKHLSEQAVKGSKLPNVICTLPGSSDRQIIVGAHYDHASEGNGVVDNWSGASLLPSLYQALKDHPRKHTFIFIGFTDHEKGQVGSHFYVQQMTKEQVAATDAMIDMDALGLAPTEIWITHSDKDLVQLMGQAANGLKLPVTGIDQDQVGEDSEQFAKRKIPQIMIHSLTKKAVVDDQVLHTKNDQISKINMGDYYNTYTLVAAYLALLDESLPKAAAAPAK